MTDLEALTAADFAPLLHESFRISADGGTFDAELIDVAEAGRRGASREQFPIVFRGGPNPPLPQGIYRVEHERLGAIEIFLVAIATDRDEAVFT